MLVRAALIEMGSTSFRLTVNTGQEIDRRSHHLHLGASVSSNGSFTERDIAAATRVTAEFMTNAKTHNCQRVIAVATESFRLAANGLAVASHIEREAGCQIKILLPEEENTLTWQAVANHFPNTDHLTTIALSGGSLGISSGSLGGKTPAHNFSYPLGTGVLAPRASKDGYIDTSTRIRLEHHIAESLKPAATTIKESGNSSFVIVGGMPLAMTKLIHTIRRSEVPENLNGLGVDCSDLGHLIKTFSELSIPARLALPGMSSKRCEYMPLGVTILRQTMRSLGVHAAVVSTSGPKETLLSRLTAEVKAA